MDEIPEGNMIRVRNTRSFRFIRFWPLVLLSLLALSTVVNAQDATQPVTDNDVNRVSRELYCPICENTPLDVCETQACEDWRQLIREKLEAGETDQQIVEYFANIYGERARATPTTRGFSKWVWIAPIVGAVVGVAFFARLLRRWLAQGRAVEQHAVSSPTIRLNEAGQDGSEVEDYISRLEREIKESG
jgi:cytochrome c-type biogenesis protein CcmH